MNVNFRSIRGRNRKKRKRNYGVESKYLPTNIPFWADISVVAPSTSTKPNTEQPDKATSSTVQDESTMIDLTDDNSPSVPFAESNTIVQQGVAQVTKKPTLTMHEKTHEKIKQNQAQNDKSDTQQSVAREDINEGEIKQQHSVASTELKAVQTPLVVQEMKPAETMPAQIVKAIPNSVPAQKAIPTLSNKGATQSKQNKTSQIPVLAQDLATAKKIPPQGTVKAIPTLNKQATTKGVPHGTMRLQQNYQNYNIQADPNSLSSNGPLPRGVPITFLRNQQRLGAIEPQKDYMAMNAAPVYTMTNQPMFQQPIHNNTVNNFNDNNYSANTSTYIQTDNAEVTPSQAYSPSDLFAEARDGANETNEEVREGSSSPDICQPGRRRLSAFKRLGPLTQPKKPKLTINLSFDKEQPVREVVGENRNVPVPEVFVPVHKREDILTSTDDIVMKYLLYWPWKNNVVIRRGVTARASKSAMMMEQEQMEETYEKDSLFIQLTVKGYPNTWKKEDVLDAILESVKGKSFIPCFTEFTPHECKFLVIRSRPALVAIHKYGFCVRKDDVVLTITISKIDLSLKHIDFLPKLILRKRLSMGYDSERKLSLKAFTLQRDISHFIYFPLNRINNQADIVELQSVVAWKYLTDLDLSNNRLTTLIGFDLQQTTPKLQHLDVSNNCIEKITVLLQCRELPLKSLMLEGNPLCTDYTDPQRYVKVVKMIFPMLKEIDGLPIVLQGELPLINKHFCPNDAKDVVDKFLELYFPILDSPPEDRAIIEDMYADDAFLTVTHRQKLCLTSVYRRLRSLFFYSRNLAQSIKDYIKSSKNITKLLTKWPSLEHDPTTFTVDVMWYTESSVLMRIGGIVKVTSDSLAVDEHMLAFTRTILLHTDNGVEYKIRNEMVFWDLPTEEFAKNAFRINTVPKRKLSVSLETMPDKVMKEQLLNIFMRLTDLDKLPSEKCLEEKDWNLKNALEYFTKLLKLNHIDLLCDTSAT